MNFIRALTLTATFLLTTGYGTKAEIFHGYERVREIQRRITTDKSKLSVQEIQSHFDEAVQWLTGTIKNYDGSEIGFDPVRFASKEEMQIIGDFALWARGIDRGQNNFRKNALLKAKSAVEPLHDNRLAIAICLNLSNFLDVLNEYSGSRLTTHATKLKELTSRDWVGFKMLDTLSINSDSYKRAYQGMESIVLQLSEKFKEVATFAGSDFNAAVDNDRNDTLKNDEELLIFDSQGAYNQHSEVSRAKHSGKSANSQSVFNELMLSAIAEMDSNPEFKKALENPENGLIGPDSNLTQKPKFTRKLYYYSTAGELVLEENLQYNLQDGYTDSDEAVSWEKTAEKGDGLVILDSSRLRNHIRARVKEMANNFKEGEEKSILVRMDKDPSFLNNAANLVSYVVGRQKGYPLLVKQDGNKTGPNYRGDPYRRVAYTLLSSDNGDSQSLATSTFNNDALKEQMLKDVVKVMLEYKTNTKESNSDKSKGFFMDFIDATGQSIAVKTELILSHNPCFNIGSAFYYLSQGKSGIKAERLPYEDAPITPDWSMDSRQVFFKVTADGVKAPKPIFALFTSSFPVNHQTIKDENFTFSLLDDFFKRPESESSYTVLTNLAIQGSLVSHIIPVTIDVDTVLKMVLIKSMESMDLGSDAIKRYFGIQTVTKSFTNALKERFAEKYTNYKIETENKNLNIQSIGTYDCARNTLNCYFSTIVGLEFDSLPLTLHAKAIKILSASAFDHI